MISNKIPDVEAIAFDIDGTLYPAWKFTVRVLPFFIRHMCFMNAFGKTRRILHKRSMDAPDTVFPDFFNLQNELLAAYLNISVQEAGAFLEKMIYKGWKKTFLHIRPYPFVKEAIERLKFFPYKRPVLKSVFCRISPPNRKVRCGEFYRFVTLRYIRKPSERLSLLISLFTGFPKP